ncbi:MAG: hypothetical protein LBF87_00325 [Treponema sp.]|nr:hypothetical protein [Treponema sp.]
MSRLTSAQGINSRMLRDIAIKLLYPRFTFRSGFCSSPINARSGEGSPTCSATHLTAPHTPTAPHIYDSAARLKALQLDLHQ